MIIRGASALALVAALSGCAGRMSVIRPYTAHPTQVLESENDLVDVQGGVRTTIRHMSPEELDDVFRKPGKGVTETGNPFLYRPPHAPMKFTVFQFRIRNESDFDIVVDPAKILLRDAEGTEFHPLTAKALTDYWIGRVAIELGKPRTWTAQMESISRRDIKEKLRSETVYEGGLLPTRGEHTGYIAFSGLSEKIHGRSTAIYQIGGFVAGAGLGALTSRQVIRAAGGEPNRVWVSLGAIAGGLLGRWISTWLIPDPDPRLNRVSIVLEVVTRSSRYGNPLNVALFEYNFSRSRVERLPKGEIDPSEEWRNH
ncbi:MAG: hypothetical protein AAB152_10700 [Candidatus Coatesbacteria bacterium]